MKPSVLFIDDDKLFLDSLKRTLRSPGKKWRLYFTSDTNDAYKILSDNTISVIIADIMMPGINGIEFLEKAQKDHPLTSRIMLSGNPQLETAVNALNRGRIIKYLIKPCNKNDLVEAIQEGVSRNNEITKLLIKVNIDGLTNLYNKSFIENKLEEEVNRAKRYKQELTILMLDIDHFKAVNDTYGHLTGDEVLMGVANCLQNSVRATDFLGRYGGEEFLIVFPQTGAGTALKAAERFRRNVSELKFTHRSIKVTISGGLKQYSGEDTHLFLNKTDQLLYEAKNSGRNKILK